MNASAPLGLVPRRRRLATAAVLLGMAAAPAFAGQASPTAWPGAMAKATTATTTTATTTTATWAVDGDGQRLFEGQRPLRGRVSGHDQWLPPGAVACANCHRTRPGAATPGGAGGRDAGPPLHADALLRSVERRGGPPSRYDRDAFCRALRRGEDPAGVVLPRAMPRYDVGDGDCDALWRFLTAGSG